MKWNWFSSFFDAAKPRTDTAPLLGILESENFNLLRVVSKVLMDCLWLRLGKGTSQEDHSDTLGITQSVYNGDPLNNATVTSMIGIQVSIEIVCPPPRISSLSDVRLEPLLETLAAFRSSTS